MTYWNIGNPNDQQNSIILYLNRFLLLISFKLLIKLMMLFQCQFCWRLRLWGIILIQWRGLLLFLHTAAPGKPKDSITYHAFACGMAPVLDKIMCKSITLMNNGWMEWFIIDHGWNTILKCFLASLLNVLCISEVPHLEA